MYKLIKIDLKKHELENVQFIANTQSEEVLIPKSELGLFSDFLTKEEKQLDADYILFCTI